MEFKDWLWGKFDQWRGRTTKGPTAYARYLGVKQQYVSRWLDGEDVPKAFIHIQALAEKYPDVYEVLGLPDPLAAFPADFARRLRGAMVEIREEMESKGVSPEDPRAEEISNRIMSMFGFTRTN